MSFRPLAERVLTQTNSGLRLSEDATIIINQLMSLISSRIQPINSIEQLRATIPQILPGALATNANAQIDRIINQLGNTVSAASQIEGIKTGIYEYLLAEILELGGNIAEENNENVIDAYIIISAIRGDPELFLVFRSIVPQFPYGNTIDIASIVQNQTQKYNVVPGFVLSIQDYIQVILAGTQGNSVQQLTQLSQKFGVKNPQYQSVQEAQRGLAESIIGYIIQKAQAGKQPQQNEELGFMDVLSALQTLQ